MKCMSENKLFITPKTKVGELLDAFPQLEPLLIEIAPAFSKLKHPVLRKTIARVTSLQQAAAVGNVNAEEMILRLRQAVGQDTDLDDAENQDYFSNEPPAWFSPGFIVEHFDAVNLINSGQSPMNEILSLSAKLETGAILEILTPFVPVPIIDMLRNKGFQTYCLKDGTRIKTYISH